MRSIYPRNLERDYAARLKRRLRQAAQAVGKEVKAAVAGRFDSAAEEERIRRSIGRVRIAYFETYTVLEDQALAVETEGRVEGYINRQVERQYKSVLGVDPLPTRERRAQAEAFVAENVSLITSIGEEFFDKLEEDILGAYAGGARWEQLAEKIQGRYDVSARRAELIARDQIGSLNAKLAQAKQTELGVKKYIWRNSQDERVVGNPSGKYPKGNERHGDHWSREGKVFDWGNPPHDGHPGEAIQCRCTAEPVWFEEDVDAPAAEESDLVFGGPSGQVDDRYEAPDSRYVARQAEGPLSREEFDSIFEDRLAYWQSRLNKHASDEAALIDEMKVIRAELAKAPMPSEIQPSWKTSADFEAFFRPGSEQQIMAAANEALTLLGRGALGDGGVSKRAVGSAIRTTDHNRIVFQYSGERGYYRLNASGTMTKDHDMTPLINIGDGLFLQGDEWEDPNLRTVFHELGHYVEDRNQQVLEASLHWIERRTAGEKFELLADITGDEEYGSERTKKDEFWNPYIGKDYSKRGSEVFSMGFQHFTSAEDMADLYNKDPEHYALTMSVLEGRFGNRDRRASK
jgi:SPP1 gp7 family putative phage head morphogenesis protein